MDGYGAALLLAFLPAAGNVAGGVLGELVGVSRRTYSLALHAAAGVVIAVVAVELIPRAMDAAAPWLIIVCFGLGGAFYLSAEWILDRLRPEQSSGSRAAWLIFFGVAMDLFSDGVMIGAGSTVSSKLALLLALGQVPADLPEGFATVASLKSAGVARARRLLVAAGLALPVLLGATVGYFGVRGQPEIYKLGLLAFTAGVLLTVVVEEMVPEAHEQEEARLATVFFIGGFGLFMLLSAYF